MVDNRYGAVKDRGCVEDRRIQNQAQFRIKQVHNRKQNNQKQMGTRSGRHRARDGNLGCRFPQRSSRVVGRYC